jgi:hypothetical protein
LDQKLKDKNDELEEIKDDWKILSNYELFIRKTVKENIEKAIKSKESFDLQLERLKSYENRIKTSTNFTENSIEQYVMDNFEHIKAMEQKIKSIFDSMLERLSMNDKSSIEEALFHIFECRFILTSPSDHSKVLKKMDKRSVKLELDKLNEECKWFSSICEDIRLELNTKCDLIASKLKNCYVVHQK